MESHKIHVPNHQPVMGLSFRAMGEIPMIMRYCDDLLYQLRLPDCQIASAISCYCYHLSMYIDMFPGADQ